MKALLKFSLMCLLLNISYAYSGVKVSDTEIKKKQIEVLLNQAKQCIESNGYSQPYVRKGLELLKDVEKMCLAIKYKNGLAKCYIYYVEAYSVLEQKQVALNYYNKALAILSRSAVTELSGDLYITLALYYYVTDDSHEKKIALFNKAVTAFNKAGLPVRTAEVYEMMANQYHYMSYSQKAIECFKKSIYYYNKSGYRQLQKVYDGLGDVYTYLHHDHEGLQYGLAAVKLAERYKDTVMLPTVYTSMGLKYFNIREPKTALQYFEKGLPYAVKNKDTITIYYLLSNSVSALQQLKQYDKALIKLDELIKYNVPDANLALIARTSYVGLYLGKKENKLALKHAEAVLKEMNTMEGHIENYRYVYKEYIDACYANKMYAKAREYVEKYKNVPEETTLNGLIFIYNWQFKLDSVEGNPTGALKNYQAYIKVKDDMYNETKSGQFAAMAVKYESEKKDNDIKLLANEGRLQKQKIIQAGIERNYAFAGAVLIILIAVVIFIAYRNKLILTKKLRVKQLQITRKNKKLSRLVTEKEWLLKEIHHRVKNNLQIVMSLLNSQSVYLKEESAKAAIANSQRRIHSMALIHQKLYQTDSLSAVAMDNYIRELVVYLSDSFDTGNIHFEMDIDDAAFEVSQAVTVGLILNEAITNCIKYAFNKKSMPVITISLRENGEGFYELVVKDNGNGLPEDFDIGKVNSLGMRLIKGLSQDLDGSFEIYSNNGTVIRVRFKKVFLKEYA